MLKYVGRCSTKQELPTTPNYLDSFSLITLDQMSKIISFSKPTICVLYPIPMKLLKEILPLIYSRLLNKIHLCITTRICTTVLETSCNQTPSQESTLDPEVLDNYRPISNLPFLSKILGKVVANQLSEFLQESNVYEDFQTGFRVNHSTEKALQKSRMTF